jgi:hypothetical protein
MVAYLEILLHHTLLTVFTPENRVHAPPLRRHVLPAGSLSTGQTRAFQELVLAVFVDMRLHMAARQYLFATFTRERAPYLNVIAHVDQKAWDVHKDILGRGPAARTWKVVWTGINRGDGAVQTFLTEHMITLQSHRPDEGTMAYGAHQVLIVSGNIIQGPQIDGLFDPAL